MLRTGDVAVNNSTTSERSRTILTKTRIAPANRPRIAKGKMIANNRRSRPAPVNRALSSISAEIWPRTDRPDCTAKGRLWADAAITSSAKVP
ncbi:hypothetical protein D9M73_273320 [compost metagenome]